MHAVHAAVVRPVDEGTARRHLSLMMAVAEAGAEPVARRPQARRAVWRTGLAAGMATLLLPVGMSFAGLPLPGAVQQAYRSVGVELPGTARDPRPAPATVPALTPAPPPATSVEPRRSESAEERARDRRAGEPAGERAARRGERRDVRRSARPKQPAAPATHGADRRRGGAAGKSGGARRGGVAAKPAAGAARPLITKPDRATAQPRSAPERRHVGTDPGSRVAGGTPREARSAEPKPPGRPGVGRDDGP